MYLKYKILQNVILFSPFHPTGAQYILRYRKYHLTISQNDADSSPLHTPRGSIGSLQIQPSPPSRALSTTTLLSEVIYLVKLRTKTNNVKHSILRESVDAEAAILTKETKFNDPSKSIHSNRYLFLFPLLIAFFTAISLNIYCFLLVSLVSLFVLIFFVLLPFRSGFPMT